MVIPIFILPFLDKKKFSFLFVSFSATKQNTNKETKKKKKKKIADLRSLSELVQFWQRPNISTLLGLVFVHSETSQLLQWSLHRFRFELCQFKTQSLSLYLSLCLRVCVFWSSVNSVIEKAYFMKNKKRRKILKIGIKKQIKFSSSSSALPFYSILWLRQKQRRWPW